MDLRATLFFTEPMLNPMPLNMHSKETAFKRNGIPYRIIGGTRFFDRAEVKDMLAYLCVINNRNDDLRLTRIINNPTRGIGPKALETAQRMAQAEGVGLYKVINDPYSYGPLEKVAGSDGMMKKYHLSVIEIGPFPLLC